MPNIEARPRRGDRPDRPTTYRLTWDLPPGEDGSRRRLRETFHGGKKEALEYWTKRQAEINGAGAGYVPPSRTTLGEFLTDWLANHESDLTPSTARRYGQHVRLRILPHLGHVRLRDLTAPQLRHWLTVIAQETTPRGTPVSPATVIQARVVLHAALDAAVTDGLLSVNPLDTVAGPKLRQAPVEPFSLAEMKALQAAMQGHPLADLFQFLWQAGCRVGEAIGLRWTAVDLTEGTVRFIRSVTQVGGRRVEGKPKTEAGERMVALPAQTVDLLREHRARQEAARAERGSGWNPDDLVFPSRAGTALFYRNVRRAWVVLRQRAGLPPRKLHVLRHTNASLQLQAGVGLREMSAHLGHSDPAFTARVYAHVLEATRRQAARKFDRLLEDGETPHD